MILHKKIDILKQQLLALGALVEQRVDTAVKSVQERNLDLVLMCSIMMAILTRKKLIWKKSA